MSAIHRGLVIGARCAAAPAIDRGGSPAPHPERTRRKSPRGRRCPQPNRAFQTAVSVPALADEPATLITGRRSKGVGCDIYHKALTFLVWQSLDATNRMTGMKPQFVLLENVRPVSLTLSTFTTARWNLFCSGARTWRTDWVRMHLEALRPIGKRLKSFGVSVQSNSWS